MELGFEYSIFFISLPCLYALGAVQTGRHGPGSRFVSHPGRVPSQSLGCGIWLRHGCGGFGVDRGRGELLRPSIGADIWRFFLGLAVPAWYTAVMILHSGRSIRELADPAIDVLLCSYSGNPAHFTEAFAGGAREAGAAVRIHRFHYAARFRDSLDGDALVLAFPVIGWKPPWPFLDFLIRSLPAGNGRPRSSSTRAQEVLRTRRFWFGSFWHAGGTGLPDGHGGCIP